ncbi:NAD(P)H-hydrate dehydratase [Chitinophaga rhizophila]|uniref:Bifunctional NAD(P)H-hydrate repair enzyme n=1 Tax=Chitinophaga rhizophila TaxID=2866212 RepID=A0ABS7GC29_9BACT|nr:NAD(P)H-hydrate dehydratase [Chitinophaga rhizophila]MBW8684825.1 NAD(P)H-hydrate dehydratase [Chitinophaga rhizophila]
MKIFTAQQIREADAYTIANTPISSLDLMEKAAIACTAWICRHYNEYTPVYIFCGMGNNGGDGLAITRLLRNRGYEAHAYVLHHSSTASADHTANRQALQQQYPGAVHDIAENGLLPRPDAHALIVDAILGTGLSRPAEGWTANIIHQLNDLKAEHDIVAIDIPSGLQADASSVNTPVIKADHTLSFEFYKLAFLLPENAAAVGEICILTIDLSPEYIAQTTSRFNITDIQQVRGIYRPRKAFSHKGTFGHALLIAGSEGKTGAAVLSAKACLRTGVGLLTCHIPKCGYEIIQIAAPGAMCFIDEQKDHSSSFHNHVSTPEAAARFKTIGIGPGLGTAAGTCWALEKLLDHYRQPMVLDADALNILSSNPTLLNKVPHGSILTPHPKEFERLFGRTANDVERLQILSGNAVKRQLNILLKGRYTAMAFTDGSIWFNTTGNPGMATGGSGDVLTGILTSLLAQGYNSRDAMLMGVYLHGLSGDYAAAELSEEAMIAEDIVEFLGRGFQHLRKPHTC